MICKATVVVGGLLICWALVHVAGRVFVVNATLANDSYPDY